jgi:phosphohistidine phosphatase
VDLYFIRHAEAVPRGTADVNTDEDRPLTEHGHAQARALSAALQRCKVRLDVLLTSPLLRARQTAEDLLNAWPDPKPELLQCDELAPEARASKLARALRKLRKESVGLVGHMPDLATDVAWLVGSKKAQLDLEKAGVARVVCAEEPDKGSGVLVWLVPPEWFMKACEAEG